MKASLDTNVIIHLYRANKQDILFGFFDEIVVYQKIREIELENHADSSILNLLDEDIFKGKIKLYTDELLKEQGVFKIFEGNVKDNRNLYSPKDLGEVYAISLAQTLGVHSLITDDIKAGGPYTSLLSFVDHEIMPFTFVEILILRFLGNKESVMDTLRIFDYINDTSGLQWSFNSHLKKFVCRFCREPFKEEERKWLETYCANKGVSLKRKLMEMNELLKSMS